MADHRRKWAATEKLRIVLAGIEPGVEIADLCRREGVSPTQFYGGKHSRIKPHCPEENGIMERAKRTLLEQLVGEELIDPGPRRASVTTKSGCTAHWASNGNDHYRADPEELREQRRLKLAAARHERCQ